MWRAHTGVEFLSVHFFFSSTPHTYSVSIMYESNNSKSGPMYKRYTLRLIKRQRYHTTVITICYIVLVVFWPLLSVGNYYDSSCRLISRKPSNLLRHPIHVHTYTQTPIHTYRFPMTRARDRQTGETERQTRSRFAVFADALHLYNTIFQRPCKIANRTQEYGDAVALDGDGGLFFHCGRLRNQLKFVIETRFD